MPDQPSIQIDDDWKRQAQEEKRRLAEEAAKAGGAGGAPASTGATGVTAPAAATGRAATAASRDASRRDIPAASFAGLVQSLMTQAMLYMGELAVRGGEPMLDLDLAKRQIDMLGVLEDKTKNNLSSEERRLLDSVLYDLRTRFISISSQYVM